METVTVRWVGAAILHLLLALQDAKAPVPSNADQKRVDKELRELFKAEYGRKDRQSKRSLAEKLLAQAAEKGNDSVTRFVLLRESRDLGVESLDLEVAFTAITRLAEYYEIKADDMRVSATAAARKSAASSEDMSSLAASLLRIADQAVKRAEFDYASKVVRDAEAFAKAAKDAVLAARSGERLKEVAELNKESDEIEKAQGTLKVSPDDPEANLLVGRYLLFVKSEAAEGLARLAKGSHVALRDLAAGELANPKESQAMVQVADSWMELAEKERSPLFRKRYEERAWHWYLNALNASSGLQKVRLEKRLAELDRVTEPNPNGLVGKWMFDEGTGGVAADASPRQNHAKLQGGAKWVSGANGSGLAFDGVDDYVTLGVAGMPAVNAPHSVAWAYQVAAVPSTTQMILSYSDDAPKGAIHVGFSGAKMGVMKFGGDFFLDGPPPTLNAWHYCAYTFDGSVHRLYVNGELKSTSSGPSQSAPTKRLELGRWWGGGGAAYFNGTVDEVRMYSRAITEPEIQGLVRRRK